MPTDKKPVAFRLSGVARTHLTRIAESLGVSLTAALEVVIREAAKKRGIISSPE